MQVVMGYGHNKLSLEEAEELLKEVNSILRIFSFSCQDQAGGDFYHGVLGDWTDFVLIAGRLGWRWETRLHRVYTDDALGLGGLAVNTGGLALQCEHFED